MIIREVFDSYNQLCAIEGLSFTKVFIAEDRGGVLGFVETYVTWIAGHKCGVIYYIGVRPRAQGRGIGRGLVKHVEEYMKKLGVNFVLASTVMTNRRSRCFFNKMGYYEYSTKELEGLLGRRALSVIIRRLYITKDDDVILIKPLRYGKPTPKAQIVKMLVSSSFGKRLFLKH